VISGRTNKTTDTISFPENSEPFGVAADPKTGTIYVAQDYANAVAVINGRTNTVTATIPVGSRPLGVAWDPRTSAIYVANTASSTVSVLASRPCCH
jgi:YVTN family beta-propeller protein